MSPTVSTGYRLSAGFSLHFDGVEVCLYSADRVSGTVLRGLTARMAEQLWHHGERHGVITDELFSARPLGIPADLWQALVAELCRRGILEPMERPPAASSALPTPITAVRVETPVRLREQISMLLSACGATIHVAQLETRAAGPHELVVLLDDRFHVARHRELNRMAALAGAPFLSLRLMARSYEMGPLVLPGIGACFECYWQRLQAPFTEDGPPAWVADSAPRGCFLEPGRVGQLVTSSALHALALEIHRALHGPTPTTLSCVLSVDLEQSRTHRRRVLEVPGCGDCALAAVPA
ncbi:MAG TPA: TOMM precursor leader peptide-binding protein [Pseudonocardiaceae bacterium]|jgi:bacteriocin biosynthesis cyclodehydratase domain-containing protein